MTQKKSKEIRVEQIIEAAILEFIEKGYEAASMESIAKRAKLSKGGLYHHFNSKDEIMIAANNKFMEPIYKYMHNALNDKSPVNGLKNYIHDYISHWENHPNELVFTFLSLAKVLSTKEMWVNMNQYVIQTTDFFKNLLKKGIEAGELLEHDYDARSIAITASLDGIVGYTTTCESLKSDDISKKFISIFIDEIKKNKT